LESITLWGRKKPGAKCDHCNNKVKKQQIKGDLRGLCPYIKERGGERFLFHPKEGGPQEGRELQLNFPRRAWYR